MDVEIVVGDAGVGDAGNWIEVGQFVPVIERSPEVQAAALRNFVR
jgi:hypothetical protein